MLLKAFDKMFEFVKEVLLCNDYFKKTIESVDETLVCVHSNESY